MFNHYGFVDIDHIPYDISQYSLFCIQAVFFDDVILPRRHSIKFIVCPEELSFVERHLSERKIRYEIRDSDVQRLES